ncbi:MAG: hypothetical protein J6S67_26600 [Methanobrevibacter sp.]|nr:hypothetical protein [Methanobrevibacter sp.]
MEQKLYARVGRSFKPIPNYVGTYWDGENWTKERTEKSIARCYDQKGIILYMFFLWKITGVNWFDATKEAKAHGGYLPSHVQAALATERCEELREDNNWRWTRDEYKFDYAWSWNWHWNWRGDNSFAYFYYTYKPTDSQHTCANIFFDFSIKL